MKVPRQKSGSWTYADYLGWPEGERWELIGGIAWACALPSRRHQQVLMALGSLIWSYFQGRPGQVYAAPFELRLPDAGGGIAAVLQPDLCVVTRRERLDERGCLGAPDWILEVVAPESVSQDFIRKLPLYERHQVPEYWLVHAGDETIQAYSLGEDGRYGRAAIHARGDVAHCPRFPGLHIELDRVFGQD